MIALSLKEEDAEQQKKRIIIIVAFKLENYSISRKKRTKREY